MSDEFESTAVTPEQLQPARYFAASYAGEHVAGTEFVIGALFVAWGVSTGDILWGLLLGNLLAVLTWALICAPIATQTRLTLYAYLEKIGGVDSLKVYSVINGVLFCILAGSMITVSASAVRIIFDIPPQVNWYPTSIGFIAVALCVGAVVVAIASRGFKRVAQFAQICAPWMILMFVVGALAMLPLLANHTDGVAKLSSWNDFLVIADAHIWQDTGTEIGFWHVAAFAWICNLAMHGSLSDMTVLRFARKSSYGYFSAFGMFLGHYLAWICAGIMGAGAAMVLSSSITALDAGEVAYQALGMAGIVAVIIAGWTTSNPTIYRAGLAFQSLNTNWSRTKVTVVVGIATTIISCFPFVFTKLLGFVGLMGLILAPVGAVITTEHWILPKLGMTRYWVTYSKKRLNWPAMFAWGVALVVAWLLNQFASVHLFFLLIPAWLTATLVYIAGASFMGARNHYEASVAAERENEERIKQEVAYLEKNDVIERARGNWSATKILAWAMLAACVVMGLMTFLFEGFGHGWLKTWLIVPTIVYFIAATPWSGRQL